MDTPDRSQIGTPISKFEDSPVFNYINNLSPIKPVKSIHITQTFNSLSFAALPSIFTSPHVSAHKEFRFLRRHNLSETNKSDGSDNESKFREIEGGVDVALVSDTSTQPPENFNIGSSLEEASAESLNEHRALAVELSQTSKFDCASPTNNQTPCSGVGTDGVPELAGTSKVFISSVHEASEKGSLEGEVRLGGICQTEETKEESGCDWESLISDSADVLIFNSPSNTQAFQGLMQKSTEPGPSLCTSLMSEFLQDDIADLQNNQYVGPVGSGEQHDTEDPSTQPGEASVLKEISRTENNLTDISTSKCMTSQQSEKTDNEVGGCMPFAYKPFSNLHRGMRRRCLIFEMTGAHRKNLNSGSNGYSSNVLQSDGKTASNDEQLVPSRPDNDSPRCVLPGIGLHLNALTATPRDHKIVKHETFATGGQPLNASFSTASFHSMSSSQEPTNQSLALITLERDGDPAESGILAAEDISQASTYVASEDFNQNSPKRKRRRLDHAGESEGCKRCNCKKSKCLKLYCECFAAGVYCVEPCSCQECFNKPIHEDTVLATRKQIESRNPLAFAPKVIRSSDSTAEIGDESSKTPASARHKRGCNCKKSSCLKKYCECYQGGVGCSINCRCEGCKNAFGRKDGSAPLGTEAEQEEEETESCEKTAVDEHSKRSVSQNDEEENPDGAVPATPLRTYRSPIQLPFALKKKPPRCSVLAIGSSSGLQITERFGKSNFLPPQPKFEKHFQTTSEDDMPGILKETLSPDHGIKASSPNSKRVSPPHFNLGSTPGRLSGRKLILQSIPSFPSLTPQH